MERVLITGASGFIGRCLAHRLVESHRVVAAGRHDPRISGIDWVPIDLAKPDFVSRLPADVDVVIHLAAATPMPQSANPKSGWEVNATATELLVHWAEAVHVGQFLFASTGSVYGGGRTHPYREDDGLSPDIGLGPYVAAKVAAEEACRKATGPVMIILRPFFPYGHGQAPARLLPRLYLSIARGDAIAIHGADGAALNPTHLSDVVAAMTKALCLTAPSTINIAGPEVMTVGEIVRAMSAQIGKPAVLAHEPHVAPKHLVGDITKMAELLHTPRRRLSDELRAGSPSPFSDTS